MCDLTIQSRQIHYTAAQTASPCSAVTVCELARAVQSPADKCTNPSSAWSRCKTTRATRHCSDEWRYTVLRYAVCVCVCVYNGTSVVVDSIHYTPVFLITLLRADDYDGTRIKTSKALDNGWPVVLSQEVMLLELRTYSRLTNFIVSIK